MTAPRNDLSHLLWYIVEPFTDERGGLSSILKGFGFLFFFGAILGLTIPTNPDIPNPLWRSTSSIIGYTYTMCWNISWYPQIFLNIRRKSAAGLSLDSWSLDVMGYLCYTIYTAAMFASPSIRQEFEKQNNGDEVTVQSNDVVFAVHSLLLSTAWVGQIGYYEGFHRISEQTTFSIALIIGTGLIGAILASSFGSWFLGGIFYITWLEYLYLLSFIKTVITVIMYIPQVLLNYKRKSCSGWMIWNVLLDLAGGILSTAQTIGDAMALGGSGWDVAIEGNFAKFGIAFASVAFNVSALGD
jgi:cystinosin